MKRKYKQMFLYDFYAYFKILEIFFKKLILKCQTITGSR